MGPRRRPGKRPRPHLLATSSFARSLAAATSSSAHKRRRPTLSPPPPLAPCSSEARPFKTKPHDLASSSDDDSDDDEEEEEEEEDLQEMETVQADFGFFDPKPRDFSGVKLLLQRYLDDKPWDLSGFVDLILEQTTVGTLVKLDDDGEEEGNGDGGDNGDDDDSPYAAISALNLKRYAGHKCISELREYLLSVCDDQKTKKELKPLLEEQAGDVGLLVSQRFINCPYQLISPLYDALFDEVSWAIEDEPTQELRDFFRFKFYLLITRIYMKKDIKQPKRRSSSDCDEPIIYIKAEDEFFHELSALSFTFTLHAEQLAPPELKNYREMGLVMVVKADKVPQFREKLKSLVDES